MSDPQGSAEGQGGSPSEWARERARALRKQLCKGRDPLLTNVRVYPDPTAEIEDVLARALDAAREEERGELWREGWLRHAAGCSAAFGDTYRCRCGLAAALRARGEEATHE